MAEVKAARGAQDQDGIDRPRSTRQALFPPRHKLGRLRAPSCPVAPYRDELHVVVAALLRARQRLDLLLLDALRGGGKCNRRVLGVGQGQDPSKEWLKLWWCTALLGRGQHPERRGGGGGVQHYARDMSDRQSAGQAQRPRA